MLISNLQDIIAMIFANKIVALAAVGTLLVFSNLGLMKLNHADAQEENGYELQQVKDGVYVVSAGGYNSMFVTSGQGVLVVDAPPGIGDKIFKAISEVTDEPVIVLVYSHAHKDHIGSANIFPSGIRIIAQDETAKILRNANDPGRPVPNDTFVVAMTVKLGEKAVELFYPGPYHQPGNIFVHIPEQKLLMVVDQLSPGEVPWKHLAVTPSVPSLIKSYDQALAYNFDIYVPGHGRIGTQDDIQVQKEYVNDLRTNAITAFSTVDFSEATKDVDPENNAAMTEAYFNALTNFCVEKIDEKWTGKLDGVGVWTDEHCEKMILSVGVD